MPVFKSYCMNKTSAFPYPDLLEQLPRCMVTETDNYYQVCPHKAVRLYVKVEQAKFGLAGIYILAEKKQVMELRGILDGCKEIYNMNNVEEPWLFISEEAVEFSRNKNNLARWINELVKSKQLGKTQFT